jgi:hypothetical protein
MYLQNTSSGKDKNRKRKKNARKIVIVVDILLMKI